VIFERPQVMRLADAIKQRRLAFGAHASPGKRGKGPRTRCFCNDPCRPDQRRSITLAASPDRVIGDGKRSSLSPREG
jgi:hypothetical protein